MKRIVSVVLILVMLFNITACGFFGSKNDSQKEEPIPHHEKYVFNSLTPTDSYQYEARPYKDKNSKPIIMGGNYYHGGFTLSHTVGPYTPGYANFNVSEYNTKKLSFVLGSVSYQLNDDDRYAILSVYADGKQVVDALVKTNEAPKYYTVDLTGVSELSFKILEGECELGIAEMTVWDTEPERTGPAIAESTASLQLIKDILPFHFEMGTTIYTDRAVSDKERTDTYNGAAALALQYVKNETVNAGGKEVKEAITMFKSIPLAGEDIDYACFNTENRFGYLSFYAGCLDKENGKAGKSWVSVFADGVKVCEELVVSNELPKQYIIPINFCATLRFEVDFEEGGDHYLTIFDAFVGKTEADVGGSSSQGSLKDLPDVCKLVSSIKPYAVASHASDPLFDGSTQHRTFTMAGRKYNEGVVLYAQANMLFGNSGSHACFNLEGEFKYLTFKTGIIDKTPSITDDTLKIYLDGQLAKTIELHALDLPQEYMIELNNCKELKIELVGEDKMIRPAYAIAEMVVYRHEVVEHELFPKPVYNYPAKMDLVSNIRPYLYNFGPGDMGDYKYVYDGSTKQNWFMIDGEKKYEGLLLQTSVHLDLTGEAAQAGLALAALSMIEFGGLFLLASDVAHESSLAAFDMNGEFKTLKFTVACQDAQELWDTPQTETLKIGSNKEIFKEIEVSTRMKPTTYTVDIKNAEQLVFWLQCGKGSSSRYAIYDITVEK